MAKLKTKAYKRVELIEVYLWKDFVGAIALDPGLQYYVFAYDKVFGKKGVELSPLHMPLNDQEKPYVFTDLPQASFKRLPALFADVLPDDFGNALINSYMASKGIDVHQITPLDRLAYMGKRAMGALEFKPVRGPRNKIPTALEMGELVLEARRMLRGELDQDDHAQKALRSMIDVGTSAGGARAKAVLGFHPQTQEIRSGQVDLPQGFQHWLLKFDGMGEDKELGSSQHYGRIEYAYYLMAKECGIHLSPSRLLHESDRAHFMTKRFDREEGNIKHHIQTLCAMDHLDFKQRATHAYEQLFMTLRKLGIGHEAEVEAFRRMVFNVMAQNCDDHTKNISFILRQGHAWDLAPAYDVTFAYNPQGEWTHQHLMSVNGKFKAITKADCLAVADRFGLGEAKQIIEEIREALGKWPSFAKQANLPKDIIKHIQKHHQ